MPPDIGNGTGTLSQNRQGPALSKEDAMRKHGVLIPFILTLLFFLILPAAAAAGGEETHGAAWFNSEGLSHFNRGYYEELPAGKEAAAEESFRMAREAFQKAVALDDGFVEAHRNLGRLYGIQKKYELAAEEYRKVVDLEPGNVDAYLPLASALDRLGRVDEALDILKRAKSATADPLVLKHLDGLIEKLEADRGTK
jgi:tetratricopeptide (TPR) repeat protein